MGHEEAAAEMLQERKEQLSFTEARGGKGNQNSWEAAAEGAILLSRHDRNVWRADLASVRTRSCLMSEQLWTGGVSAHGLTGNSQAERELAQKQVLRSLGGSN